MSARSINPASFGEDARGNLYVVDIDGEVFRLTPTVASSDVNDTLRGLGGNDRLFGGAGADLLDGGTGADFLNGGAGDDFIVYRPGDGADLVFGFVTGAGSEDRISVSAFANITSFADVLSHATQVDADTVINFGSGDTLTLRKWCAAASARTTSCSRRRATAASRRTATCNSTAAPAWTRSRSASG